MADDYGLVDHGNIVKYGRTGKSTQRLKCTTCEKVFVAIKGTVFYGSASQSKRDLRMLGHVRTTLSFSKETEMLEASCAWEDWVYNLTRPVKSLRVEVNEGQRRWRIRSAAMAAGLTDHVWTDSNLNPFEN